MDMVFLKAYAKINLFLQIHGRRQNGYHDMSMVNQSISICDKIKISPRKDGKIRILDVHTRIPLEQNIMYTVAKHMKKKYPQIGIDIEIQKNIPMQAGMGGGSADAAAIVCGLNKLYGLDLTSRQMIGYGLSAGADVPFCLFGGSKYVEGVGEIVKDITCEEYFYLLVKPRESMSTKLAFAVFDQENKSRKRVFPVELYNERKKIDIAFIKEYFYNDFESILERKVPLIKKIKEDFYAYKASFSMMSGSGTTVYGLFLDKESRDKAYEKLKEKYENIYRAQSYSAGVEICEIEEGKETFQK